LWDRTIQAKGFIWPGYTYSLDRKLENRHLRDRLRGSGRGELKDNFKIDIAGIDYDDVRWVNLVYTIVIVSYGILCY
jgi:hypothetical protein